MLVLPAYSACDVTQSILARILALLRLEALCLGAAGRKSNDDFDADVKKMAEQWVGALAAQDVDQAWLAWRRSWLNHERAVGSHELP